MMQNMWERCGDIKRLNDGEGILDEYVNFTFVKNLAGMILIITSVDMMVGIPYSGKSGRIKNYFKDLIMFCCAR